MLHAIISKSFFSISPSEDLDLDYIQMFERDGKRYLKRLADLDVEHWNVLCLDLRAYIDADQARRGDTIWVDTRTPLWPQALPIVAGNLCARSRHLKCPSAGRPLSRVRGLAEFRQLGDI